MPLIQLLFGFHGRITAAQFRQGGTITGIIVGLLLVAIAGLLTGAPALDLQIKVVALMMLGTAMMSFLIWSNASLQAKRLHDRGRSGFLALISVFVFLGWSGMLFSIGRAYVQAVQSERLVDLPYIFEQSAQVLTFLGGVSTLISIWIFIDLGLMPGAAGPNQFGPPSGSPQTPEDPTRSRRSWFTPKQSAPSWDVAGAQAALDAAIAERNASGAAPASEMWKPNAQLRISNAQPAATFGRRQ